MRIFHMMLTALVLLSVSAQPRNILFVGNSLLMFNEVPAMVTNMLNSDGQGRNVKYASYFVGHLEDVQPNTNVDKEVSSGKYDVVVLQSAMVSSSLSRTYSQARGIAMAKAAKRGGARVLLYVEWPRRGVDETEYTMNVYRGIAKAADTEITPVCYAWNSVLSKSPNAPMWQPDGNHAMITGSYLAACCVYFQLVGTDHTPTWRPQGVDKGLGDLCMSEARVLEKRVLAKKGRV
jgi:hypothetical protein